MRGGPDTRKSLSGNPRGGWNLTPQGVSLHFHLSLEVHQTTRRQNCLMGGLLLLNGFLFGFNTLEELVEGVCKFLYAFILQLLRHLSIMDADLLKGVKFRASLIDVVFDTSAYAAMVTEVFNCLQRHRINGVWTDQFLSIEHIAVCWILGAGTGPQWPLYMGTFLLEWLEA